MTTTTWRKTLHCPHPQIIYMRGEGRKWKNQQGKRNVGIMRQQQTRKIHRSNN
jgi:hypothetical protein